MLYSAVARAYGDDEKIQYRIIESASPLPTHLRGIIAMHLGEESVDEAFPMSLLRLYDQEQDGEVKTQAAISYYSRVKTSRQDVVAAVETLSRSIICVGFDHEERRQAAFCGLVALGRLDVMINAKERDDNRPCAISIVERMSPNVPLVRYVLRNWEDIKAALGDEFWPRLSRWHSGPLDLWNTLCSFADAYPSPRDEALRFLEERPERTAKPNILRFLGRVCPRSPLLLEYCLKALCIGEEQDHWSMPEAVVAAELVGTHFGGESDVLARVMSLYSPGQIHEGVILALCESWPESEELNRIVALVCEQDPSLTYATYLQLISRKSPSEVVLDALIRELSPSRRLSSWYSHVILRPILRRLQADDDLLAMLSERLLTTPTPSEKTTIPRLIGAARGVPSELRAWCLEEMNRQMSGVESPQIGIDLISGELRPVAHALLDTLSQSGSTVA